MQFVGNQKELCYFVCHMWHQMSYYHTSSPSSGWIQEFRMSKRSNGEKTTKVQISKYLTGV